MTELLAIPDLPKILDGLLQQVPRGRVTTYGRLALALGNANAARWVGQRLLAHPHTDDCPCHRVVRVDGRLGGYLTGLAVEKAARLEAEGVVVEAARVDLARYVFDDFESDRPLAKLADLQSSLASKARTCRRIRVPKLIGGVDVSYPRENLAVGAYTLIDTTSNEVVWHVFVEREIHFPYITSFLSFRELPVLLDLAEAAKRAGRMAEVVLVDGSGTLHPRRVGIASHFGVLASVASIGVTKTLLCGRIIEEDTSHPDGSKPILVDDRPIGMAIPPTPGSRNPLFVSPGHRVDVDFAVRVVRRMLRGHRLPEPLYWADRLSRIEGRRRLADSR